MKTKAENQRRTDLPIIEKYLNKKGNYCPHLSNLRKAEICQKQIHIQPKEIHAYVPFSVFRPNNRVHVTGIQAHAFILADNFFKSVFRKKESVLKQILQNNQE